MLLGVQLGVLLGAQLSLQPMNKKAAVFGTGAGNEPSIFRSGTGNEHSILGLGNWNRE